MGYCALLTANHADADDNSAFGLGALQNLTEGAANVAVGKYAGSSITTGDNNVYIGKSAAASAVGVDTEIVIGSSITGKGTNTAFIGGTAGPYNGKNTTAWEQTSDQRIKKNIVSNNNGLDLINQLEVKNFEYKTEDEIKTDNPELSDVAKAAVVDKTGIQLGMIAQEVEAILPNCVKTTNGIKSLNTTEMFFYMVNAIKELSAEVKALKAN